MALKTAIKKVPSSDAPENADIVSQIAQITPSKSEMPVDDEGRQKPKGTTATAPGGVLSAKRNLLEIIVDSNIYIPARVKQVLKSAESGYIGEALLMFQRMIEGDADLYALILKRRLGMRKAQIMLQPPEGHEADPIAMKAVEYCRFILPKIVGWPGAILDLLDGDIKGFSAKEIEWVDKKYPIALHDCIEQGWRWENRQGLMVQNNEGTWVPVPAWKFLIHSPRGNSPNPLRRGVMRSIAMIWVIKQMCLKDYAAFVETYGIPPRILTYPSSMLPTDPALQEAFDAMTLMGSMGFALIRNDFDLGQGRVMATRGSWSPHPEMIATCNAAMAKAILTETLSTDTAQTGGTYAAARIHSEGSKDLIQATADGIADDIVRDLIVPMVGFGLGWDIPVPILKIDIPEAEAERDRAELFVLALNQLQMSIPAVAVYNELRIPIPKGLKEDEVLRANPLLAGQSVSPAVADKLPGSETTKPDLPEGVSEVPGGGGTPEPELREGS